MTVQIGDGAGPTVSTPGICIAFGSDWNAYDPSGSQPLWARLDDPTVPWLTHVGSGLQANTNSVVHWETSRGRQYELGKTQAGTATIRVVDKTGLFDPTLNGPYRAGLVPMKPAKISLQNPHNNEFYDIFTGYVDSYTYSVDTTERWMVVDIHLVDGFDVLSRFEVDPDQSGLAQLPGQQVDDRFRLVLDDFTTWNMDMTSIFTGNVVVQPHSYQAGTSSLAVLQDAADSEFPNVANIYIDKHGFFSFRGRFARFNYTNPQYGISQWDVGDIHYTQTFGGAPIAAIDWNLDEQNLINACLCYPYLMPQGKMLNQIVVDSASIAKYGIRSLTIPDLLVYQDNYYTYQNPLNPNNPATGNPYPFSGKQICNLFGQYFVDNYATPQNRISKLEFRSRLPGNSEWWQFVTGVEIGDVVSVNTRDPGGGGFVQDKFFVEGIHFSADPLQEDFPDITMSIDVSPVFWYQSFPGFNP